jgi:hypothetical protein
VCQNAQNYSQSFFNPIHWSGRGSRVALIWCLLTTASYHGVWHQATIHVNRRWCPVASSWFMSHAPCTLSPYPYWNFDCSSFASQLIPHKLSGLVKMVWLENNFLVLTLEWIILLENTVEIIIPKSLNFFLFKIIILYIFLNHFNMLMLKLTFIKQKILFRYIFKQKTIWIATATILLNILLTTLKFRFDSRWSS